MIKKAVYPGSFDPITKGHIDIIKRAKKLCNKLIIAILYNSKKTNYWFDVETRKKQILESLVEAQVDLKDIEIIHYDGLLVDLINEKQIDLLIRGLRAISDYEYELQLNLTNELLAIRDYETIFLNASRKYLYLSSSVVKEIAINKGRLDYFLTPYIENEMKKKVCEIYGEN